MAESTKRC